MAFEYQSFATLGVNLNRQKYGPLDISNVFTSQADFDYYISKGSETAGVSEYWYKSADDKVVPYPYSGQIVALVIGDDVKVYVLTTEQDGKFQYKEVGAGGSTTHVVDQKSDLTSIEEAKVGEEAFVKSGDDAGIYVLTQLPASSLDNWAKVNSDVTWASGDKINFRATTYSSFKSLSSKDTNTLYVLTDAGKIYKGTKDITSDVSLIETEEEIPDQDTAVPGTIYIAKDTFAIKVLSETGEEMITVSPGYVTDGSHWAEATDDSKLVTLGVVKTKLTEEIGKITESVEKATISTVTNTFTEGKIKTSIHQGESDVESEGAELTGVAYNPTYAQSKLTIKMYGSSDVVVDFTEMLKDKFLSSAEFEASYDPSSHEEVSPELSGKQVVIFTIDGAEQPLVVDLSALVDTYKAKSNSDNDNIKVTIENNEVSASLIITDSGDASKTLLTVDESGKLIAKAPADAVGDAITEAINSAISSDGALKTALEKKLDKLAAGAADDLVTAAADGSIQRTGKKIGSSSFAEVPDENTLATEVAVTEAIENALPKWETIASE